MEKTIASLIAILIIAVVLMFSGCIEEPEITTTPTPTQTTTPTPTPTPTATPSPIATDERMVVNRNQEVTPLPTSSPLILPSERTIFRDEITGTIIWQMTNNSAIDTHQYFDVSPWSPDGSKIVFISDRNGRKQVWMMESDGENLTLLSRPNTYSRNPIWSKDGKEVYFVEGSSDSYSILAVNVKTFEIRTIFTSQKSWDSRHIPIRLSPNGNTLVYPSDIVRQGEAVGGKYIRSVGVNGSNSRIIIEPDEDTKLFMHPLYSPKEDLIMYLATSGELKPNGAFVKDIYISNDDGSHKRKVVENAYHPIWSPDGKRIAFFKDGGGLRTIDKNGDNERILLEGVGGHVDWSPGGDLLVVDEARGDLILISPKTDETKTLCYHESSYDKSPDLERHPHPHFSPDGQQILFASDRTGNLEIYIAFLNTTQKISRPPKTMPLFPLKEQITLIEAEGVYRKMPFSSAPINDSVTSGGAYLRPNFQTGIRFAININKASDLVILGRVRGYGNQNSFWVRVDGEPWLLWDIPNKGFWQWEQVYDRYDRKPKIFHLTQGYHTIEIAPRELGSEIDQIKLEILE